MLAYYAPRRAATLDYRRRQRSAAFNGVFTKRTLLRSVGRTHKKAKVSLRGRRMTYADFAGQAVL